VEEDSKSKRKQMRGKQTQMIDSDKEEEDVPIQNSIH
jgi:hypothetical protein